MPSGKTHERLTYAVATMTPGALIATGFSSIDALVVAGSCLAGGIWLSPDLDIHSLPFKRWGVLKFYWIPYQKIMGHRGISHVPVLGTLTRIGYLMPVIYLVMHLNPEMLDAANLLLILTGLELSAMTHVMADLTWSTVKRMSR